MKMLALLLLVPSFALGQGLTVLAPGQTAQRRTNYALQSNSATSGTSNVTPWTPSSVTLATVAGAPVSGTWAEVTSTASGGVLYAGVTQPSAKQMVLSAYISKASGTGSAGIYTYRGGNQVTSCTCIRSDGGTCDASITDSGIRCVASVSDLGSTPVRLSAVVTYTSDMTDPYIGLIPGAFNVSTGTTRFAGMQHEVNVTKPSKLCVTTTAAKTCKN